LAVNRYAVRAYTPTILRYSKDIDCAVRSEKEMEKIMSLLQKIGYTVNKRTHGASGFRKIMGEPLIVNVSVNDLDSEIREIHPFYGENKDLKVEVGVCSIEDLLTLKAIAAREKDIIDISILLLDSFNVVDIEKLKDKLHKEYNVKGFESMVKTLMSNIGSKNFHMIWKHYMRDRMDDDAKTKRWTVCQKTLNAIK